MSAPNSLPVVRATKNPILPKTGVCDPHIHVFGDRAYLFASHDTAPKNSTWRMRDWQVWSSGDLVEWRQESTFRPEDTYIGPCERCWAVDAAERNGRYFLYFSEHDLTTGVAVSEHPGGPYRDALGRPLLPKDLTDTHQYDPTVFIDDDESRTPYLIWGSYQGSGYKIARLASDMLSLAEPPRQIQIEGLPAQDDKNFLHKHGGRYYLTWGSFHAVSDSIHGPYRYLGNFGASHDHGSFFSWRGQDFNAFTVYDPTLYFRGTGICYVHYKNDGRIVVDPLVVEHGVGRYDASWNQIRAAWFMEGDGIRKRENHWERIEIEVLRDGAHLIFPRISNMPINPLLTLFGTSNRAGTTVEARLKGPNGPILGSLTLPEAKSWGHWTYQSHQMRLNHSAPELDLCLTVKGVEGEGLMRFEYFRLTE
ncbi:MAG: family 43 glycosylhydrolase [Opitutaceae bacterium]|nr:family 43 glycosylhydrolase [Opitutaceae bacterium]